jgi:hypothetical protein
MHDLTSGVLLDRVPARVPCGSIVASTDVVSDVLAERRGVGV